MKVSSNSKYDMLIEIECMLDSNIDVAASTNLESILSDHDYVAFLINFENKIQEAGFVIAETHSSNRPDSLSEYYAIFPADKNRKPVYTIMIILRISDHRLPRGEKHGQAYYNRYAQENKYPQTKQYQQWKFETIRINKNPVRDYDDALLNVEYFLSKWRSKSSDVCLIISS